MKEKTQFEVGDRIVYVGPQKNEHIPGEVTELKFSGIEVLFDKDKAYGKTYSGWDFFEYFELDPVCRSPLWKALK